MSDEKITIRVNVDDRYYPLKIDREEEERVRKAAKRINEVVLQYRKVYADKDGQDFLAMAALQFVTKLIEFEENQDVALMMEQLKEIGRELDDFLRKEQDVLSNITI